MSNVRIKVDPAETNGVKVNTTATAMTITAIGDVYDESTDPTPAPTGELSITENGTYDVSAYASAEVAVESESSAVTAIFDVGTDLPALYSEGEFVDVYFEETTPPEKNYAIKIYISEYSQSGNTYSVYGQYVIRLVNLVNNSGCNAFLIERDDICAVPLTYELKEFTPSGGEKIDNCHVFTGVRTRYPVQSSPGVFIPIEATYTIYADADQDLSNPNMVTAGVEFEADYSVLGG